MTTGSPLTTLLPLLNDLSRDLPPAEHYRRLLLTLRAYLPCDALALLRLEDDVLVPVAVLGLSPAVLGRRFPVSEHPRLAQILANRRATRFAVDCPLPDPFDGQIDNAAGPLPVHDCLGCPLTIDGRIWGVLSLDAVDPARFGQIELPSLDVCAHLAAAVVKTCERMNRLARQVEEDRHLAQAGRQTASAASITDSVAEALLLDGGLRQAVDDYQRQLIETVLRHHQGNLSATARALQLDRGNLHRLTRRLGLTTTGRYRSSGR